MTDFNLHTHTKRCHHAKGEDEEYVKKAIENGFKTIGFSDHAPYVFPADSGYYSGFRINLEDTADYAESVKKLRDKYKGIIDIKFGFELEYYPSLHREELEYLKLFDYDYLICGQHYIFNEYDPQAVYTGSKTGDEGVLCQYVKQVIEAANTGDYAYIAHPDLINFTGDGDFYKEKMRYMIKELKRTDIPLEFNFLGFTDKRNYPNDIFWKMVAEEGNRVVLGLDAHKPSVYSDKKNIERFVNKLLSFGITPIGDVNEILR